MTTSRVRAWGTAMAILVSVGALARVSGQALQPSRTDDILPALLLEVKGLRAAMEQMSTAGPAVQLFVSRLQLQEGRISGMIRRLDTVRDSLAAARRDLDRFQGSLKMLTSGERKPGEPPDGDLGPMLAGVRHEVAAAQANADRLAAEEAQLTQEVAVEQARWVEINQRLDELERTLAPKR